MSDATSDVLPLNIMPTAAIDWEYGVATVMLREWHLLPFYANCPLARLASI